MLVATSATAADPDWPRVFGVERQPLLAAAGRVITALEMAGRPLNAEQQATFDAILNEPNDAAAAQAVQDLLDPLCLLAVHINAESRVKLAKGDAPRTLIENGWTTFLIKVHNEAGITPPLTCTSPQAAPQFVRSTSSPEPKSRITPEAVKDRWLGIAEHHRQPLSDKLSGLAVEYRVLQLYSRDQGKREATLAFDIGQGTQDLGFRNELALLFDCHAAEEVRVDIRDASSDQLTAALEIRDAQGRVYPNPARRLAPDFFFHNQVYRRSGETLTLPAGSYDVRVTRGPEYLPQQLQLNVAEGGQNRLRVDLQRWIDPTQRQWYSGDHHVHAAGCAHYENPTEGVAPDAMMRHILGEDLKVGCVLSWGPCWYTQKKYFEGNVSELSRQGSLMRYDVEVSGFPSSHAGHLCLLRLTEDDYPGTERIDQWPSWTLPVLRWGKQQGGVVGYSHSGWGLSLPDYLPGGRRAEPVRRGQQFTSPSGGRAADRLPDYAMPMFDGIGANEYIVAVTHDVCDFISAVDTPAIWELNIWYHTLNCGFRTRISGETDFPCIYGERVGLGRIYVQLDEDQPLDFDRWVQGLKAGRSYCGDGKSHVLQFSAAAIDAAGEEVQLGCPGNRGNVSQLDLAGKTKIRVRADVAALLKAEPDPQTEAIRKQRLDAKPYWHIERCRVGDSRQVAVELVSGGKVIGTQNIEADGSTQSLEWEVDVDASTWLAVRILPSVHTNPIFVVVNEQPIRTDVKSARWCRDAVDVCWSSKHNQIAESERDAAAAAYEHARRVYDSILAELAD